ncbi:MAG: hypothetical protein JSV83_03230 [Desulfobacterales bacterium]|nr:MAG: hypothetical protein JSV83_03230 [Desulfobacterales bacterium]
MKQFRKFSSASVFVVSMMAVLWLVGCAAKGAPEKTNCDASIKWEVVDEAKLIQFECALGKHEGYPSLIFTVGLENPTDKPLRYRLIIFLDDMDKANGHLVPRTGKPPVIEPGKSQTVKIPFMGTDKFSKKILVVVRTIEL